MRSKTLRALGLSLMAMLGLLAFTAASASAENLTLGAHVHGKVLIEGSEALATGRTFTGTAALIQLKMPTLGAEIHCPKATLVEGKIISGPAGEGLVKILFEECKVYAWDGTTLGVLLPCNISNGGAGKHITATAILLVVTHKLNEKEDRLYVVAEPDTLQPLKSGEPFAEVQYEAGKGCALPLAQKITGSYTFEVTQAHQQTLTLTPGNAALQTLMGTGLFYGAHAATISGGVATGKLTGSHANLTWGLI